MEIPVSRTIHWLILFALGTSWGLGFSLARMAALEGGRPFGIAFWSAFLAGIILIPVAFTRARKLRITPAIAKFILVVALLGSAVPGVLYFWAAAKIESGVLAITVSIVPIATYTFAVLLKRERIVARRAAGVVAGFAAICLLVLPESNFPDRSSIPFILLASGCAFCYAAENLIIDIFRPRGFHPVQLTCCMNLVSAAIVFPIAIATGQMIFPDASELGRLEFSLAALGVITALAYTMFVYLISTAGPVFASQTGYLVTICGVLWGMVLFGESHPVFVWFSFLLVLVGVFLVNPRSRDLVPGPVRN